jgi:hypothetical protein
MMRGNHPLRNYDSTRTSAGFLSGQTPNPTPARTLTEKAKLAAEKKKVEDEFWQGFHWLATDAFNYKLRYVQYAFVVNFFEKSYTNWMGSYLQAQELRRQLWARGSFHRQLIVDRAQISNNNEKLKELLKNENRARENILGSWEGGILLIIRVAPEWALHCYFSRNPGSPNYQWYEDKAKRLEYATACNELSWTLDFTKGAFWARALIALKSHWEVESIFTSLPIGVAPTASNPNVPAHLLRDLGVKLEVSPRFGAAAPQQTTLNKNGLNIGKRKIDNNGFSLGDIGVDYILLKGHRIHDQNALVLHIWPQMRNDNNLSMDNDDSWIPHIAQVYLMMFKESIIDGNNRIPLAPVRPLVAAAIRQVKAYGFLPLERTREILQPIYNLIHNQPNIRQNIVVTVKPCNYFPHPLNFDADVQRPQQQSRPPTPVPVVATPRRNVNSLNDDFEGDRMMQEYLKSGNVLLGGVDPSQQPRQSFFLPPLARSTPSQNPVDVISIDDFGLNNDGAPRMSNETLGKLQAHNSFSKNNQRANNEFAAITNILSSHHKMHHEPLMFSSRPAMATSLPGVPPCTPRDDQQMSHGRRGRSSGADNNNKASPKNSADNSPKKHLNDNNASQAKPAPVSAPFSNFSSSVAPKHNDDDDDDKLLEEGKDWMAEFYKQANDYNRRIAEEKMEAKKNAGEDVDWDFEDDVLFAEDDSFDSSQTEVDSQNVVVAQEQNVVFHNIDLESINFGNDNVNPNNNNGNNGNNNNNNHNQNDNNNVFGDCDIPLEEEEPEDLFNGVASQNVTFNHKRR